MVHGLLIVVLLVAGAQAVGAWASVVAAHTGSVAP